MLDAINSEDVINKGDDSIVLSLGFMSTQVAHSCTLAQSSKRATTTNILLPVRRLSYLVRYIEQVASARSVFAEA
eukprot:1208557-Amphidinium_carterae.1